MLYELASTQATSSNRAKVQICLNLESVPPGGGVGVSLMKEGDNYYKEGSSGLDPENQDQRKAMGPVMAGLG